MKNAQGYVMQIAGLLLAGTLAMLPISACKKSKVDPMPQTGSAAGWTKSGETRNFAAAELWNYIDGGAEQYVQAGVVTTATSDYKYQGKLEAVVDVHTFSDTAGARNIFEASPAANGKPVALGDAGLSFAQSTVFRKGPYLVRIVAYESNRGTQDALLALAHSVEAKL